MPADAERGVALRPHVKTHKSVPLARIQLDAGAARDHGRHARRGRGHGRRRDRRHLHRLPGLGGRREAPRMRGAPRADPARVGVDSAAGGASAWPRRCAARPGHSACSSRSTAAGADGRRRQGGRAASRGRPGTPGWRSSAPSPTAATVTPGPEPGPRPRTRSRRSPPRRTRSRRRIRGRADQRRLHADGGPAAARPVNEVRPGTYLIGDRHSGPRRDPARRRGDGRCGHRGQHAVAGQVVINAGAKSLTKDRAPTSRARPATGLPGGVIERLSDYHGAVPFPTGTAARSSARWSRSCRTTSAR